MDVKWKYSLTVLGLLVIVMWMAVLNYPKKKIQIITCDVGQGDASLIIYGETQILIDGGPNDEVLGCLSDHIPFWDTRVEMIVITHPQKDHFGGIIDVLKKYDVDALLSTSLDSSSQEYSVLKSIMGGSATKVINPTSGMVIRIGMIYLDILHPSEEFLVSNSTVKTEGSESFVLGSSTTSKDPNEFSIVLMLRLGEFEALFTGDIGPELSNTIAEQLRKNSNYDMEYIKIPHHGSKNGVTEKLLDVVKADIAGISAGEKNRYGHPHESVLKMLEERGIDILRTDKEGTFIIESDTSGELLMN